jgi:hypothetical protein
MRRYAAGHLLILLTVAACQSGQAPKTDRREIDSVIPDTIAVIGPKEEPEDTNELQIQAPDTLFEDGSKPGSWSDAGFDDPEGFKRFLLRFKEWVRTDNVDSISAYISYPLKQYKTPEQFRQQYASIFDQRMKDIVAQQRLDRIFRNYQGAMLGNGAIWFSVIDKKGYRIIAINK